MNSKKDYVESRKADIDKWNTEIEDLSAKINQASLDAQAKIEHKDLVHDLRKKRDEARVKLEEIQSASDDKWETLKDGVENIWKNAKNSFERVKAKF